LIISLHVTFYDTGGLVSCMMVIWPVKSPYVTIPKVQFWGQSLVWSNSS